MSSVAQYLPDSTMANLDRIERALLSDRACSWTIEGEATSGKSTVLRELQQRLTRKSVPVVHLASPANALDAAPCLMMSLAGQLQKNFPDAMDLTAFLKPAPWDSRLSFLRDCLEQVQGDLVVIADEPSTWPNAGHDGGDVSFQERTQQVMGLLGGLECRLVITGRTPSLFTFRTRGYSRLELAGKNQPFLRDRETWGELSGVAADLAMRSPVALDGFSTHEIRLLVGLCTLSPQRAEDVLNEGANLALLRRAFQDALCEHAEGTQILRRWQLLSLCRKPLTRDLLEYVEDLSEVTDFGKALIRHCLLSSENDSWFLHGTLRQWQSRPDQFGHQKLAEFYHREASTCNWSTATLEAEAEAFYHAVESGGHSVLDHYRCYFVEQLNILGRRISHTDKDYAGAAKVFERALQWDAEDAYANHYLAFNLDIQALEPAKVEKHYKIAVNHRPDHPWCYSRWINFLLTFARTAEARKAWYESNEKVRCASPNQIYRELHFWVIRMLLHRGQLEFAREILESIPANVLANNTELKILSDQYENQRLARSHGSLVPSPFLRDGWWREGPFLLKPELSMGHKLRTWCAGRVELIGGQQVHLKMAVIEKGQPDLPEVHIAEIEIQTLESWFLDARELEVGSYLEIGYYYLGTNPNQQVRALVHRPETHPMLKLPTSWPDPERYLRRALA